MGLDLDEVFFYNTKGHFFTKGVFYTNGVLFTNNAHKGYALFKFLENINYNPKTVVFINDKRSHLEQMEEMFDNKNTKFIGLRYGYFNDKKNNCSRKLASIEMPDFIQFVLNKEKEVVQNN